MTKDEAHQLGAVMQAWASGSEIQYRERGCKDEGWRDTVSENCLGFVFAINEYRIKPKAMEIWVNPEQGVPQHTAICFTKPVNPRWRKFREVIE